MMAAVSCDLDLYPETSYNEGNVNVESGSGSESQYTTRTDMEGLRNSIYESWTKDIQEKGYLDWLVYGECRADNAYGGNPSTGELMAIEANRQDGENKNVQRDWDWYLGQVSNCNNIRNGRSGSRKPIAGEPGTCSRCRSSGVTFLL